MTPTTPRPTPLRPAILALLAVAACAKAPEPAPAPVAVAVAPADGCAAIRNEFFADSLHRVDNLPTPVLKKGKLVPEPIPRPYPKGVIGRNGAEFVVEVLVDTLGKADMKTFKVIKSTHAYLTRSLRTAFSKWTFEPSLRRGCRVPRVFHYEGRVPGQR